MKRLLLLLLLASPLAAQAPSRLSLATRVQPGFGGTALGDTYYAISATTFGRVAGNTSATKLFWCQTGTGTVSAAPVWCSIAAGDVPTLNQNTTGSAAKWTTARTLAGNSVDGSGNVAFSNKFIVQGTADTGLSSAQFLGALSTCILKNTTSTGVLSCAIAGDFPTLNQDTTGKSGTTNALNTTGSAVDVTSTAPSGSGQACVTTSTTACTWQTVTTGSSGNVTVAAKGDIQGYSTAPNNISVGTDGQVPMADSTNALGVSYQWPGVGTMHTLKETVFAGITPASYSNGSTTTIDGSGYTATVAGNGAIDMVATGLRFRQGTTSSTNFQIMTIAPGATGDFTSIMGEARFRRGRWGFWTRLASYDYTNTSTTVLGVMGELAGSSTRWAISHRRNRNSGGAPNSSTGGLVVDYWWNGADQNISSYAAFGVTSADVMLSYFSAPDRADIYIGTYSGGWPTMESMTFVGTIRMQTTAWIGATAAPTAAAVSMRFYLGGSAASSGTYEIIIDRWRVTAWE